MPLRVAEVGQRLQGAYGDLQWWPAESAFEVMVGAVLTQNTSWTNVERAIANLRAADVLDPESLLALPHETLAEHIRPSGYFNVKADRLRHLLRFLEQQGGVETLARMETEALRSALLGVKGVGPETADDIVLYAFERPVFVVDAYTRRLFERLGLPHARGAYDDLRAYVESELGPDAQAFNDLHALIVEHGKQRCRPKPACKGCPLSDVCPGRVVV
ncbi:MULTISPECIES: endonuclease III domain-containing protein [unclassified Thioalkalivibrio]|uniref:endonuclease III domain-containing protein n=1 Tax=unclassified Thioalkalivibrio TaxID=2621013 RepID=UPI00035F686A|nr:MULTISPECIES: endonuclease III domain-containing protein [unclassified Thioalkalivibrio]